MLLEGIAICVAARSPIRCLRRMSGVEAGDRPNVLGVLHGHAGVSLLIEGSIEL